MKGEQKIVSMENYISEIYIQCYFHHKRMKKATRQHVCKPAKPKITAFAGHEAFNTQTLSTEATD